MVIEAEYEPGRDVEAEAVERLGRFVARDGRRIEAALALRYPEAVEYAGDLAAAVAAARLSYCVFTVAQYTAPPDRQIKRVARFPETGWLDGSPSDISNLIRLVSVPQLAVDEATDALERGIERAAVKLNEMDANRPGITAAIARLLGMDNVPQTHRMAGAIIANALVFHERIAGMHQGIKSLKLVCGPDVANPQSETLSAWAEILKINYWPIFAIGRDILQQLPSQYAARILKLLEYTVGELNAVGIDNAHDLTGRVFQRLISDRKYLATFYTLPASADLLARLAVAKLDGVDWGRPDAIGNLRIGDFACGTGALLSAVYEQIAARHENAGGAAANIHPGHDGGSAVRLRCYAVRHPHHRLHPVRGAAQRTLQLFPSLHDALRPPGRSQRKNRLPWNCCNHRRPGYCSTPTTRPYAPAAPARKPPRK